VFGSQQSGKMPLLPEAELQWWYQFYFATDRGRDGYDKYRRDFSRLIWQLASPKWNFDDATFGRSAAAFDNPDHVAVVIHNYRWRLGLVEGESKYDDLEKRLAQSPVITVLATPMARHTWSPVHTRTNSPANTSIGPSPVVSATICRRKRRPPSPKPLSISVQASNGEISPGEKSLRCRK